MGRGGQRRRGGRSVSALSISEAWHCHLVKEAAQSCVAPLGGQGHVVPSLPSITIYKPPWHLTTGMLPALQSVVSSS